MVAEVQAEARRLNGLAGPPLSAEDHTITPFSAWQHWLWQRTTQTGTDSEANDDVLDGEARRTKCLRQERLCLSFSQMLKSAPAGFTFSVLEIHPSLSNSDMVEQLVGVRIANVGRSVAQASCKKGASQL